MANELDKQEKPQFFTNYHLLQHYDVMPEHGSRPEEVTDPLWRDDQGRTMFQYERVDRLELEFNNKTKAQAIEIIEQSCSKLLANPNTEVYQYKIIEE